MSGAPRRAAPLRAAAGRARAGIVAMGRGAALAVLALAALIPFAALLVLALTPVWGIWTAITLDGAGRGRWRLPSEGLPPGGGGWFTQVVNLPAEALRPIFGAGFLRAVCMFLTALALAVIPLAAPPLLAGIRQVSSAWHSTPPSSSWAPSRAPHANCCGTPAATPRRLSPSSAGWCAVSARRSSPTGA